MYDMTVFIWLADGRFHFEEWNIVFGFILGALSTITTPFVVNVAFLFWRVLDRWLGLGNCDG